MHTQAMNHRIPAPRQSKKQKRRERQDAKNEELRVKIIEIEPKTARQEEYLECVYRYPLTFASGPAGTGKTFLAVAEAVNLVNDKRTKYEKIIIVRPAVEAGGEKVGFLPGKLDEKYGPYMIPVFDSIRKIVKARAEMFIKNKTEIAALAYMRGRTLENAVVLLDEAQNMTPDQMLMFLTRIGNKCKVIVTGDPQQNDMGYGRCGLTVAMDRLRDSDMIGMVTFDEEDVVRSRVAREVLHLWNEAEVTETKSVPVLETVSRH